MKPQSQFASWTKQADPSRSCLHVRQRERPLPDPEVGTVFLSPPAGPCPVPGEASSRGMARTAFLPSDKRLRGARTRMAPTAGWGWLGPEHGKLLAPRPPTPGTPHAVGPSQIATDTHSSLLPL